MASPNEISVSQLFRLMDTGHIVVAVVVFVTLFFLNLPYPLVIAGAAIVGATCFTQPAKTTPMSNTPSPHITSTLAVIIRDHRSSGGGDF